MLDKISEEIWTNLVCTIDNNIIDFFYTKVTHVLVNQAWAFSLPWRNNWDEQLKCLCMFIPIVRKPGISACCFHKKYNPCCWWKYPKTTGIREIFCIAVWEKNIWRENFDVFEPDVKKKSHHYE